MNGKKPSQYTLEFKQSSAKLAVESDQPMSQTARDLGIAPNRLYAWVAKFYPNGKSKAISKDELEKELKELRRENALLQQERDILKKAAACQAKLKMSPVSKIRMSPHKKVKHACSP